MVERKRSNNLNIRVSDEELEMLRMLAELSGLTNSDIVRLAIRREYVEKFGDKPPPKKKR